MDFNQIFKNWESPFVTRDQICKLTGGMISNRTLQNLDSLGQGVQGKTRVSHRKVAYPVKNVISWLEKRASKFNPELNKDDNNDQ